MTIQTATPDSAAEILALQKLAYLSEAEIYDDYSIPPLTQTLAELIESSLPATRSWSHPKTAGSSAR